MDGTNIKEIVKEKYGQAALRGKSGSCCGTADASGTSCDPITSNLYDATQMQQVPGAALQIGKIRAGGAAGEERELLRNGGRKWDELRSDHFQSVRRYANATGSWGSAADRKNTGRRRCGGRAGVVAERRTQVGRVAIRSLPICTTLRKCNRFLGQRCRSEKYGQAALRGKSGSCCGTADASGTSCDPITSNLYDATQMQQVPGAALQASLGCGNPTALAKLNPGEVVLDLGSG